LKIEDDKLNFLNAKTTDKSPENPLKVMVGDGLDLPCMPGRQYLAKPECGVKRADGSLVIGTRDMMLCLVKDGQVFSLGAVTTSGGVHSLSLAPDGMTVYGVAGYDLGKGDVFRYDDKNGLRWLGSVPATRTPSGRQLTCSRPWVCAVSPDGRYIAIGMQDEMGGVGVYKI